MSTEQCLLSCGRPPARDLAKNPQWPGSDSASAVSQSAQTSESFWLLSAVLACSAMLFYVFVYTLWLKRRYTSNIVIGGAAGAVPVLVGWTAVTNQLDWAPLVLFAIIFYWTPPHFWALAIKYKDDYATADVPMLPVVADLRTVTRRIVVYTVVLWSLTIVFGPVAETR